MNTILKVANVTSAMRAKNINEGLMIKEKNGFSLKNKNMIFFYNNFKLRL